MRHALLTALLLATPATAQTPMTAEEFEAYTTGKTLYFGSRGQAYGAEEYLDNRRVRWSFLDGKCKEGIWYEEAGLICFVYEDRPEPQCWSFVKTGDRLTALFQDEPGNTELYEARQSDEPMMCLGPDVGV
ncbi:hypothetical protein [Pseudaestuariivita atlantica]|uniref:Uncharacterized protein n=1 Tax=Pseudaestuariivita atlantica TaxID=1317121 RepID=A0A0L1JV04_9RHOB|nr:hypothetical protein [Pseudaestuariivita atlantica]KNG95580.1 hypothetical protein ATO11_03055 [Pseudaestuariivita atlantica]